MSGLINMVLGNAIRVVKFPFTQMYKNIIVLWQIIKEAQYLRADVFFVFQVYKDITISLMKTSC